MCLNFVANHKYKLTKRSDKAYIYYINVTLIEYILPILHIITMSTVSGNTSKNVLRRKKSSLSDIRVTLLGDRDVGKTGLHCTATASLPLIFTRLGLLIRLPVYQFHLI